MRLKLLAGLLALPWAIAGSVYAAPPTNITNTVGVCDPNAPTHCVAPTSSGAIPVTMGMGGGIIVLPTSLLPYAFNNLDGSGNLGSQAVESYHLIKANPGNIYYLDAHEVTGGGATDYVFVLNITVAPTNGAQTAGTRILSSAALSPTQTWSWTSGSPIPMPASAGIVIACSTTDWPTLTLDAHCLFNWGIE